MAAVGFNIQHDANHNAFFPARGSKRLTAANRAAGWSIHAIGASSQRWIDGHVIVHHASPNVVGKDYDIELRPFARLAPAQARHSWHRLQHLYLWPLYGFTAVSIIIGDIVGTVGESFSGNRNGQRPTAGDYSVLMVTKSAFLVAMLGLPLLFHPWWVVALGAVSVLAVTGLLLGIVFQLAHAVSEAAFCEASKRPAGRLARVAGPHERRLLPRRRSDRPPAHLVHRRAQLPGRAPPLPPPAAHRVPDRRPGRGGDVRGVRHPLPGAADPADRAPLALPPRARPRTTARRVSPSGRRGRRPR